MTVTYEIGGSTGSGNLELDFFVCLPGLEAARSAPISFSR